MVKHTFFDKCCTIYKNSELNTGLNPVAELNYGNTVSRILVHFNIEEIKSLYDDKTICDVTKVKHVLKMTNCGSVNNDIHNNKLFSSSCNKKERATSFSIIAVHIPKSWDCGKGVDYISDFWFNGEQKYSNLGCNWFQRVNGGKWDEEGVYRQETIINELEKYTKGEESLVIAEQHFDIGNENFELDVTNYVNKLIDNKIKNNGLLICYHPDNEKIVLDNDQYVGIFTNNTNTFFKPYIETIYDNPINDNRNNFYMGKINRLYLYCHDGNIFFNLDEIPVCNIEGIDETPIVKQHKKGVYYAEFEVKKGMVEEDTILFDKWSNLVLNGVKMDDQEFEFVIKKEKNIFSNKREKNGTYIPSLNGIIPDETLHIGDIREIELLFRKKYESNIYKSFSNCYYRLYVKDNDKDIDVISWDSIDKYFLMNKFMINTNDLPPNQYFIDIKKNNEYYRDVLRFNVEK